MKIPIFTFMDTRNNIARNAQSCKIFDLFCFQNCKIFDLAVKFRKKTIKKQNWAVLQPQPSIAGPGEAEPYRIGP
jgi:hypothetical protein